MDSTASIRDDIDLVDADALNRAAHSVPSRPKKTTCTRVSEALLVLTYVLGLAFAGFTIYWLVHNKAGTDEYAWGLSAIFVGLAVPLSLHDIHMHLANYVSPLQRHFIRLIAMVPVYALTSWLALVYHHAAIYLEVVRDLYEAFALWSFYTLMLEFLGGRLKLGHRLRETGVQSGQERAKCIPPVCCMNGWNMGARFVHRNSLGLYQYVIIRTIVTLLILVFEGQHKYHEGDWSPKYFYLYAALVINGSQLYALWCLAYLYSVVHHWLTPLGPLYKFLLVKGIVAITWWQGIFINIAKANGYIPHDLFHHTPDEEVGKALGNFAFCVEMFIAAVAYHYVYSYKDFYGGSTLAPIALLQRAEAEFDKRRRKEMQSAAAGQGASAPNFKGSNSPRHDEVVSADPNEMLQIELAPISLKKALRDVLPMDMIKETQENLRTGFGLTHKWEKRAEARRAELHTWADAQLGSTVAGGGGEGDGAKASTVGVGLGAPGTGTAIPAGGSSLKTPPVGVRQPAGFGTLGARPSSMRTKTKSKMTLVEH